MSRAYLALGSNLGDRLGSLRSALALLSQWVTVEAASGVYESDPVGYEDQPRFLNAVARVTTMLSPEALLARCLEVETELGRMRSFRNAPRIIDVDIVLYEDHIVDEPGLSIPHPRMMERAFVLEPLLELEPDLRHPVSGERLADAAPVDGGDPVRVAEGTAILAPDPGRTRQGE